MKPKNQMTRRTFLKTASQGAGFAVATRVLPGPIAGADAGPPRQSKAEIIRDKFGVPHIFAETLADAVYGQAYCHAEDNLPLVLELIASSRGQGAKTQGRGRLENDFMVLAFQLPELARRGYDAMPPASRAITDAYAAGINRHLADYPQRRPAWLESVSGVDIVAIAKLRNLQEAMSEAQKDLGGASQTSRERDQAAPDGEGGASNMWALRPQRTTNGAVVLHSDPHLPWDGITKWHESHLVVGGRWIYGATFPGYPGIGIGFTQDLAWGFTNNGADIGDVYRITLDPANPQRYRYDDGWREITTRRFTVEVREVNDSLRKVERTIRFTHHGPILREDSGAHTALAVRLAGLERPATVLGWTNNFNATNLTEFETGLDIASPNKWNCIAADRHGDIAYYFFTHTHQRDDSLRWNAPVDGSRSAAEWGRPLTWRDLPHTRNPASGWLMNCNNNPYTVTRDCPIKPEAYPKHLASQGTTLNAGTRAHRADELIAAREKHDLASLETIALDIKTLTALPYVERILQAQEKAGSTVPDPEGRRTKAITILRTWDGMAATENQALPILSAFLEAAQASATRPNRRQRRGKAKGSGGTANLAALSPAEVIAALDDGLVSLRKRFGPGPVTWGMMHRIERGKASLPMPGAGSERGVDPFTCLFMAGAKKVTDGKFLCDSGSSWMQFVAYRQGKVEARTILPFGNSNDPDSPHYADQAPLFAQRQLKKALLTRSEIEAAATNRKVLLRDAV